MGCNCRHGSRARPLAKQRSRPVAPVRVVRGEDLLCSRLESLGNSLGLRIDPGGSLFIVSPVPVALPVPQALSGAGCHGSFSKALLSADLRLAAAWVIPSQRALLHSLFPGLLTTLGGLRDALRSL